MATCKTCRGEYLDAQNRCPRCNSDTKGWQSAQIDLERFLFQGGFAVLIIPLIVTAMLPLRPRLLTATLTRYLVTISVTMILCYASILAIFSSRYSLRERLWDIHVAQDTSLHPAIAAAIAFLVSIASLVVAFIITQIVEADAGLAIQLLFFTFCALGFILLTASLTFFIVLAQVEILNDKVPHPIYVNTNRLLNIALREANNSLRDSSPAAGENAGYHFEVVTLERTPDLGIDVLVHAQHLRQKLDLQRGLSDKQTGECNFWRINADKWGRIRSLKPEACPCHFHLIGRPPKETN